MRNFKLLLKYLLLLFLSINFVFPSYGNPNLKGKYHLTEGESRHKLLVKFKSDAILDIDKGKPMFTPNTLNQKALQQNLNQIQNFTYNQAVLFKNWEKKAMQQGSVPPPNAGKFNHYAFRGMAYIKEAETMEPQELLKLAQYFESLDIVEYVVLEPITPIQPPSNTPNFEHLQDYKYLNHPTANNVIGINIQYAWGLGIYGQGIKIADIEWGFDYLHADLDSPNFIELISTTNNSSDDHGTAVAGIMYAKENSFGMKGMVYGADKFYGVSEIRHGRVTGITTGLQMLNAGDVFVYEMQVGGPTGNFVPADYNMAVWDITKTATDAGIIIVAAAGNGNDNLDSHFYNDYRARGDNGSIIVGASTRVGRNKASFSTYGSPVHLQGWGDWSVATTGYGALHDGGPNATYTSGFSGTSAATPIVASAVVAVQSWYKQETGKVLSPRELRSLLIETGTPQGSGGNIGPLPNVQKAIEKLMEDLIDANYDLAILNLNSINTNLCGLDVNLSFDILNKGKQIVDEFTIDIYENNVLKESKNYSTNLTKNQSQNIQIQNYNISSAGASNLKIEVKFSNTIVDEFILNNSSNINLNLQNGTEHQFYIDANALDPQINFKITNENNDVVIQANNSNLSTTGNPKTFNFCLPDGNYFFEILNPFNNGTCTDPAWNVNTTYLGSSGLNGKGEIVSFNGKRYQAQWWTKGNQPGTNSVWLNLGDCYAFNPNAVFGLRKIGPDSTYFEVKAGDILNNYDTDFTVGKNGVITNTNQFKNVIINAYPNPFNSTFKIQLTNNSDINTVQIFEISGKKVFETLVEQNENIKEFNLSFLPNGVYFLTLQGTQNKTTLKLIKQ